MAKTVKDWLNKNKDNKNFSKELASKAMSTVLGKAGKPKSIKLKIKFGGSEKETKKRRPSEPAHTAGVRG